MKILDYPKTELAQICEALKEAAATDRMGSDEEFREWVNKELALGLMQSMAKTTSYDQEVSACRLLRPI